MITAVLAFVTAVDRTADSVTACVWRSAAAGAVCADTRFYAEQSVVTAGAVRFIARIARSIRRTK